jgi:hypothetical protein
MKTSNALMTRYQATDPPKQNASTPSTSTPSNFEASPPHRHIRPHSSSLHNRISLLSVDPNFLPSPKPPTSHTYHPNLPTTNLHILNSPPHSAPPPQRLYSYALQPPFITKPTTNTKLTTGCVLFNCADPILLKYRTTALMMYFKNLVYIITNLILYITHLTSMHFYQKKIRKVYEQIQIELCGLKRVNVN